MKRPVVAFWRKGDNDLGVVLSANVSMFRGSDGLHRDSVALPAVSSAGRWRRPQPFLSAGGQTAGRRLSAEEVIRSE